MKKNKVLPIVPVLTLPNYLVLLAHRVVLNHLVVHQVLVALPVLAVPTRLHHLVLRVVLAQAVVQAPAQAVRAVPVHLVHQALQAHLVVPVLPLVVNFHLPVHLITTV